MFPATLQIFLFQSASYTPTELGIAPLVMLYFHTLKQKVGEELLILGVPRHGITCHNSWNLHVQQAFVV